MKKGIFITHPDIGSEEYGHPWGNSVFNSYSLPFEPGPGILNVIRRFSPDKSKETESVTVRATSLGIFDMFINGIRIGGASDGTDVPDELKPGWTDYRHRVFEFEYDITDLCGEENIFAAEVSPGWWSGRISFGHYGFQKTAFCGEIEIAYTDGTSELIASGTDWDASVCGPVLRADIWDGEYYDATVPEPSMNPDAHEWKKAEEFVYTGKIVPAEGPRIRSDPDMFLKPQSAVVHSGTVDDGTQFGKIRVISKKFGEGCEKCTLKKGEAMILDFGQNMVGRPLILVKGKRGTKVSVYFAEMLNESGDPCRGNDGPRGSMYIKNYRTALARLVYVCAGNEEPEYYFPTHTFFGFRYVEIRADDDITLSGTVGEIITSVMEPTGDFFCDNPEVNRLFSNIVWGMRGNYLSVSTDCPQRDERLGWTGDTQVFSIVSSYLADIGSFMHKWLADARDSQSDNNGAYTDVIPSVLPNEGGNAAWADAGIIVPYRLYLMYNDTDIIREHFDSMEYYMQYLSKSGYDGPNLAYGDWLCYEPTDKRYIAVCYYAYDAYLMSVMADAVGKTDRAEYYRGLFGEIKKYWTGKYIKDGDTSEKSQTGYILPLAFGLVDGEMKQAFIARLRKKIEDNDYTLSTGFVGTGSLCRTLSDNGMDDLCYSLLLQTRDPSWLYSVRQGATTVWERWNSFTHEKGFGDVGMNSFNHYAYGVVGEWMFSGMCGIRPDENAPGFGHFILKPTPDLRTLIPEGQKPINMAHASFMPVCSDEHIESGWERVNGHIVYTFIIPAGTEATAMLLCGGSLKINGVEADVTELGGRLENGRAVFGLGAGRYEIII